MDDTEDAEVEPASRHWLTPGPDPIPEVSPPPAPEPGPPPASSAWDVFALIAGITGPVLALASSILLALAMFASGGRADLPLFVSILVAVGLLGVPLAWHAGRRMQGIASKPWQSQWGWVVAASVAIVILIILGQASVSLDIAPELVLAFVQPLIFFAVGMAMLALAAGGWAGLSRVRAWGHLVSGAWFSVALSIVAEIALVGGLAAMVLLVLLVVAPGQARQIISLLRSPDRINQDVILDFALQPWAVILTFATASFLIPIIEELLKPIGVILILGRRPAPMAAFLGGMMGGVGFAITETLSNLLTINDPWFVLVLARMGTLAMHGLTAGIVGWGWGQLAAGRWKRFLAAFASAVLLHGTWNGCVVVVVIAGLYWTQNPDPGPIGVLLGLLGAAAIFLLIMLVPLSVAGLWWMGYRLRSTSP